MAPQLHVADRGAIRVLFTRQTLIQFRTTVARLRTRRRGFWPMKRGIPRASSVLPTPTPGDQTRGGDSRMKTCLRQAIRHRIVIARGSPCIIQQVRGRGSRGRARQKQGYTASSPAHRLAQQWGCTHHFPSAHVHQKRPDRPPRKRQAETGKLTLPSTRKCKGPRRFITSALTFA